MHMTGRGEEAIKATLAHWAKISVQPRTEKQRQELAQLLQEARIYAPRLPFLRAWTEKVRALALAVEAWKHECSCPTQLPRFQDLGDMWFFSVKNHTFRIFNGRWEVQCQFDEELATGKGRWDLLHSDGRVEVLM